MLKIFTFEKAKEWALTHEIKQYDPFMSIVDAACLSGVLFRIDPDHYAPTRTFKDGVVWYLDSIVVFPDAYMEQYGLTDKYRYMEHVIAAPRGYNGPREKCGSFNDLELNS